LKRRSGCGFDRHDFERPAHVPGLEQFDGESSRCHPGMKPLRQWAGLQTDPLKAQVHSLNQATNASGSLKTLASRTILPSLSTTHTLEYSNDTSMPA
jgi:hypothetical protein